MDFSFILPGIRRKSGAVIQEINRKERNNIYILKEKLTAIGYNAGEVDFMIKSCCDGGSLDKLDSKQLKRIEKTLEEQLLTAKQCIDFIRESK